MSVKIPTGYAVAKGIVYGGAGAALLFFIIASAYMLFWLHTLDLNTFGDGFLKVIGGSTGAVLGHNRIMQGEASGNYQSNSGS